MAKPIDIFALFRHTVRLLAMTVLYALLPALAHGQYAGGEGKGFAMEGCQPSDCEGEPGGPIMPGVPCDDGNVFTINDVVSASCACQGEQDSDGDGTPDSSDPCPSLPDLVNGDPCDDNNCLTTGDVVTGCECVGSGGGEVGTIFGNNLLADGLTYWFTTTNITGAAYTWSILPNGVGWQVDAQGAVVSVIAPSIDDQVQLCVSAMLDEVCVLQACTALYVMDVGLVDLADGADGPSIRPNPNDGRFELLKGVLDMGPMDYDVEDATGRSQRVTGVITGARGIIDMGAAAPGVYLLRLRYAGGLRVLRVVVER